MINVQCTCGKSFTVPDEYAGKRGKCRACGSMVAIPEPDAVLATAFAFAAGDDEFSTSILDDEPDDSASAIASSGMNSSAAGPPIKPLASAQPARRQRPQEDEPWYYRTLDWYANIIKWFGYFLMIVFSVLCLLGMTMNPDMAAAYLAVMPLGCFIVWLTTITTAAFVYLAVDIGRSLRAIKHNV